MPSVCAVVGCGSRGDRDIRNFYRIPKPKSTGREDLIRLTNERRQKWIAALRRADLTDTKLKYSRICNKHFISGRPADLLDIQNPDWIPSKLMGYDLPINRNRRGKVLLEESTSPEVKCGMPSDDDNMASSSVDILPSTLVEVGKGGKVLLEESTSPEVECELSSDDDDIASPSVDILPSTIVEVEFFVCDSPNRDNLTDKQCCVGTQTDLTMEDIIKMSDVINHQMKDIESLKEKLGPLVVNEESFKDDKVTKFYTGLEKFQTLMIIFKLISRDLIETSSLTKFQQLVLTLQRLRLNLSLTDLAYRYDIRVSTATKVFQTCLYVLYKKLKRGVVWPDREALRKTMPSVFLETFGEKVPVIIDCFEIKIEKPSNSLSSAHVWFKDKHHHSTKFLLGICPQGAITFVSKGYDGRTSDKELALNCGILEKLLPGDIVLSDWGFLVCDEVGQSIDVQMPCSAKGTKHLLPYMVEKDGKLSDIRILMEKVTGNLRQKYQILQSVLPNHVLTQTFEDAPSLINQMVFVCCALNNICPTVVPLG